MLSMAGHRVRVLEKHDLKRPSGGHRVPPNFSKILRQWVGEEELERLSTPCVGTPFLRCEFSLSPLHWHSAPDPYLSHARMPDFEQAGNHLGVSVIGGLAGEAAEIARARFGLALFIWRLVATSPSSPFRSALSTTESLSKRSWSTEQAIPWSCAVRPSANLVARS